MIFFKRLFAVYYDFLIRLRRNKTFRHLNRGGTEDFGAMCLVMCSQFYLLCLIIYIVKSIAGFEIPTFSKEEVLPKVITLITVGIWLYFGSKYFISNKERRNKFIDSFRELNKNHKRIWSIISFFLMLTPVWFLLYIIIKKHY